jgi:hypothetical protein
MASTTNGGFMTGRMNYLLEIALEDRVSVKNSVPG